MYPKTTNTFGQKSYLKHISNISSSHNSFRLFDIDELSITI